MRKLLAVMLAVLATIIVPLEANAAEPAAPFPAEAEGTQGRAARSDTVETRYYTQEEITDYLEASGIRNASDCAISYAQQPSWTDPYVPGELSAQTQETALALINNMRFVAGLPLVQWDSELAYGQQVACIIGAANGVISHYPKQPKGMSLSMFKEGYGACQHSNLGAGHTDMYDQITGWMADLQDYNVPTLGHRRWILNPEMVRIAYGAVTNVGDKYEMYQSMYVHDTSNTGAEEYNVAWPAREMPLEYFSNDTPWSLSIGSVIDNPSDVEVTVRRLRDNRVWDFSSAYSDGDFYVNNDKYGQAGCVIFRPKKVAYEPGDSFAVTVRGIGPDINYTVNFFRAFKIKGDLTGAGHPTLTSLLMVTAYVHAGGTLTEYQLEVADMNDDGSITLADEVLLVQALRSGGHI